ncbi:PREDICTED: ER membrane protein complex subunit 10 [Nicrophorus vespilloides]|uniref:ER membrane protein complex subunit 10 n=1 Tax=Nicrophorus vespilloides TaxID=110193 RepID=A0ABM1MT92_NICVS|nr:PREDICTED: ER membrane protein complex subunit 10 [Nicrophorus vespilloides]
MLKLVIVALFVSLTAASLVEYDGMVQVKLEHGLDGTANTKFTERGNISIPSLRIGTALAQQTLSNEDRLKIQNLAAKNKFYQMRATVVTNDGSYSFLSSIKACMLAEAELADIITITLDYTGRIITITESIPSTSTCQGANVPLNKLKEFSSNVFVRHTHSGPGPDTASYVQKIEREREAKEKGDVKDNRSFLAKYWIYIVPVVLIMVITGTNPNEANAAGGGGRG